MQVIRTISITLSLACDELERIPHPVNSYDHQCLSDPNPVSPHYSIQSVAGEAAAIEAAIAIGLLGEATLT